MKILARASSLSGYVEAVMPTQGTIELAGLQIHMEHGAVVSAGDFVDVEATLGADRVWSGRIKAHFVARDGAPAAVSLDVHTPIQQSSAQPPAATGQVQSPVRPQVPPPAVDTGAAEGQAARAASGAQGGAAHTPQEAVAGSAQTPTVTGGQSAPASTTTPVGRAQRFGRGGGGGAQRSVGGPVAAESAGGGSASPSRPRFNPSSADQKVNY